MTEHPKAPFTEPAPYGYLYLGLRVDPPRRIPLVRKSNRRAATIEECKRLTGQLNALTEVVAVTVYEAVLFPPARTNPRFDVLVLIRTTAPETIETVQSAEPYQFLKPDLAMPARNLRRLGDIDRGTGTFLFNHFTAADPERALRTWDDIAGWFTHEAGVDDSALLGPVGESPYVFVNHVRLPCAPPRFFLRLLKPSFRESVSRRLEANGIGFAAVVCKPV
jgi:hypothetical protein